METDKDYKLVEVFDGTALDAEMVKSLLGNAGIKAFVKDEIMGTMYPWYTAPGGAGAVTIFVSNTDFDIAKHIVNEYEKNIKKKD
jgi:hypothetical protein